MLQSAQWSVLHVWCSCADGNIKPCGRNCYCRTAALPAAVRISSNKERDTQNAIQHQNIGQKKDNNVELLEQNTSVLVDSVDLNADMLSHHQRDMNEDRLQKTR